VWGFLERDDEGSMEESFPESLGNALARAETDLAETPQPVRGMDGQSLSRHLRRHPRSWYLKPSSNGLLGGRMNSFFWQPKLPDSEPLDQLDPQRHM